VERDLLMRKWSVKPLLIGGYSGSHGAKEQRLSVAARVTFDQRDIGGTGENVRLHQNETGEPRLVRDDLQPGDRRASLKRQIPQAGRCKISLLEAERDRAAHQHDTVPRLAHVTV